MNSCNWRKTQRKELNSKKKEVIERPGKKYLPSGHFYPGAGVCTGQDSLPAPVHCSLYLFSFCTLAALYHFTPWSFAHWLCYRPDPRLLHPNTRTSCGGLCAHCLCSSLHHYRSYSKG